MPKSSHIYLLIALVPLAIVFFVVYKNLTSDIESPVTISNISERVEELITNGIPDEQTPDADPLKIGETEDPKAMGYTGQDKVAVNSKGEVFTVYRSKEEGDYEIFISKVKNGKLEFEKKITDSGEDKTQRVPSIAIDQNDIIHVTWYGLTENEDEGRQIKYTQSKDDGETWSDPIIPSVVGGYKNDDYWQEHPQILADNNNLYIVWEGKDEQHEEQQVKFTKSIDGGKTWTQWKNVQVNPENTQSRPYLIFDSNKNLNLLMYSSRESDDQQIWHSISNDKGETWSDWKKVSKDLGDSRHASATLAGNKIIAVWRSQGNHENSQLYFSIFDNDEWSTPKLVMENDQYQFFPVLGTNKDGEIILTWVESDKENSFPKDDPESARGYFATLNNDTKEFTNRIFIGKDIYYPHVPVQNLFDNNFYIAYEQGENKEFEINLLTIN